MELDVYWSQVAEIKLEDIYGYHKQKAGIRVAQKIIIGIIDQTATLGKNPQMGQREELLLERTQEFRYLVYTNYKIIYWVNIKKRRVEIANVFDVRQNPIKLLETKG